MRRFLIIATLMGLVVGSAPVSLAGDQPAPDATAPAKTDTASVAADSVAAERVIAYYFHLNRRCATCQKLEAYSHEAIAAGFAPEIESGLLEWRVVNFEEKGNEHFAKTYGLFSQSVILSRIRDGKESGWKNLDQIWQLVGDKEKFTAYVQGETKSFLSAKPE